MQVKSNVCYVSDTPTEPCTTKLIGAFVAQGGISGTWHLDW